MTSRDPIHEVERLVPGCTVVVCTYNRSASLDRFLGSLYGQPCQPDKVIVVDASSDTRTALMLAQNWGERLRSARLEYHNVPVEHRGLTRQRNFGLKLVGTDLVCFFDDDVVLVDDCLAQMQAVHRQGGDDIAGVGAYVGLEPESPRRLWRLRRALGIVSTLEPGRYDRGGMSTPWEYMHPSDGDRTGDWLPGCGAMWKTALAKELRYQESFEGYCQGEDLEFSLRARQRGRLVMCAKARLLHLHESSGRMNEFQLGYMAIHNRYWIHKSCLPSRRRGDVLRFVYTFAADTLMLVRHATRPRMITPILRHVAGRATAALDILFGRQRRLGLGRAGAETR